MAEKKYTYIQGKQNVESLVSGLHRQNTSCIGIIDSLSTYYLHHVLTTYRNLTDEEIIFITTKARYNSLSLSVAFPWLSFIVFEDEISQAQSANALAEVCDSTYFLLVSSDMAVNNLNLSSLKEVFNNNPTICCITPALKTTEGRLLATVRAPYLKNGTKAEILPLEYCENQCKTLYPVFGFGFYNTDLFKKIKGYDNALQGSYWAALDFGVKANLMGYRIMSHPFFLLTVLNESKFVENTTEVKHVSRFYTRVFCVVKEGEITKAKAIKGLNTEVFNSEVKPYVGLYKTDFKTLCQNW